MKIALVHSALPVFVKTDRDLLRRDHQVHSIDFKWCPRGIIATTRAAQISDMVFAWFAGQHSFFAVMLAKALGKPIVVAAADYDLADEAWFGYGSMRGGVRKRINNLIFRAADLVLVPSAFSRDLALRNTILRDRPDKLRLVPLGFDWTPPPANEKTRALVTIGGLNAENWIRKGLREFVALSRRVDVPCYLVGRPSSQQFFDKVVKQAPPRLTVTGYLPDASLSELLNAAKVYAQLSYMEGFGCSVAESMMAACVPVVTRQGALPELVGECGYYVDYGNEDQACQAVVAALDDRHLGTRARERVVDCFPLKRRREQIAEVLADAYGQRRRPLGRPVKEEVAARDV
ncbi:MAG TPA: glycosyltransferase family 4 protein [Candidatus Binataceae bacterium]